MNIFNYFGNALSSNLDNTKAKTHVSILIDEKPDMYSAPADIHYGLHLDVNLNSNTH